MNYQNGRSKPTTSYKLRSSLRGGPRIRPRIRYWRSQRWWGVKRTTHCSWFWSGWSSCSWNGTSEKEKEGSSQPKDSVFHWHKWRKSRRSPARKADLSRTRLERPWFCSSKFESKRQSQVESSQYSWWASPPVALIRQNKDGKSLPWHKATCSQGCVCECNVVLLRCRWYSLQLCSSNLPVPKQ